MRLMAHWIHRWFLPLLLSSYLLAGFAPELGSALRAVGLGSLPWLDGSHVSLSLPTVLLSVLLFNAGVGVRVGELRRLAGAPGVVAAGLLANTLLPLVVACGFCALLAWWHNDVEAETAIMSLAVIIAMPIAGSSTAWSQNANGNVALSLGLVVLSTLLSPITTPLALKLGSGLIAGDAAREMEALTAGGVGAFLFWVVVLPSLAGLGVCAVLGEARASRAKDSLKLVNSLILLLLNYVNGSAALPNVVASPDWDYLLLVLALTLTLCVCCFSAGWFLPRFLGSDRETQVSMMYGIGMNNNGSALVIASVAMGSRPLVLVPILVYTLVQHVVGAIAASLVATPSRA